jgi:hypothetical protein
MTGTRVVIGKQALQGRTKKDHGREERAEDTLRTGESYSARCMPIS